MSQTWCVSNNYKSWSGNWGSEVSSVREPSLFRNVPLQFTCSGPSLHSTHLITWSRLDCHQLVKVITCNFEDNISGKMGKHVCFPDNSTCNKKAGNAGQTKFSLSSCQFSEFLLQFRCNLLFLPFSSIFASIVAIPPPVPLSKDFPALTVQRDWGFENLRGSLCSPPNHLLCDQNAM